MYYPASLNERYTRVTEKIGAKCKQINIYYAYVKRTMHQDVIVKFVTRDWVWT